MKKSFTIFTCFALSLLAFGSKGSKYISKDEKGIHKNKIETKNKTSQKAGADDAQSRMKWELSRLADPSTGKIPDNIRQKELAFVSTLPNDAVLYSTGRNTASLNIINRGPWNVGGRTRAFGIDVSNENRLLAGSCSGGMWQSIDGGQNWNMCNTLSQLKNATCLIQDKRPSHTNVWYYGSGEAYGASAGLGAGSYLGDGLFKSIDSGATWQSIASTAGGMAQAFTTDWQLVWNLANDVSANDTSSIIYAIMLLENSSKKQKQI